MKPPGTRPQREVSKRPLPPAVQEYTSAPAKPVQPTGKETAQDEAIRKMLEAAYT